ncbi:MAG: hypothetical protein DMF78_11445 [Acidobacteria bacterium]|nr:MAG: hypothetical protein DMF78_11445 [Acidobacteriota bacterium]
MKARQAAAGAILLLVPSPAHAHRLDEYLQATTISVEEDRVEAQIRLVPGVAVFPVVFRAIDTNSDGVIADAEQRAYAERVLRDLSLRIDGHRLPLRLVASKFGAVEEMKEGRGEIQIDFDAAVPGGGPDRRLTFENHHQSRIAAYLVNCRVPRDPDIRITTQDRNYEQSFYALDYVQARPRPAPPSLAWLRGVRAWLGLATLLLFGRLAVVWRRHQIRPSAKSLVP